MTLSSSVKVPAALFLLSFIGLLSPYAESEEGRWELIGKSRTDTCWYIDTETISYSSRGIVSAWVKTVPDKATTDYGEDVERTEGILRKIQERYFGDYEYTEGLWELDCSKNMFRLLYFCAYNKKDEIITSSLTSDAEWSFIIPGSVGEIIQEAVCKK